MKKTLLFLLIGFTSVVFAFTQDIPAYRIFNADGQRVKYQQMIRELQHADFVFYGELHNNPIAHWLELEITRDLFTRHDSSDVVLGAEMFESDNQLILNEYLSGLISQSRFEAECRLWPNYATDYKTLVLLAKENHLRFVATNVPRRYAAVVAKKGFEGLNALSDAARQLLPPLPVLYNPEVPCYKNMLSMGGMGGMGAHVNVNFPKAQALKDATMANFINRNWQPGELFIHYNGSYHSDHHEGIVWYLEKLQPEARIKVITTVSQGSLQKLEEQYLGKGDYIVVVPERMTTTY